MSIGNVKQSFLKYLLKHDKDNILSGKDSLDGANFSLFDYINEFREYLKTQGKSSSVSSSSWNHSSGRMLIHTHSGPNDVII